MNKHFHTAWILFKSIMSDLSGRIVSADSRIVEKVGKWNMEPSRLHKSLVKSFFFFFCCLIIVFFCLSFPPPSCYLRIWLKIKFHCHTHKFYMKGWEVLSVKRNTLICTHAQNWISFSLFLTYIFNKIMEVYSFFFSRIPSLNQWKRKLFKKQRRSFNNLRDSWHLICIEGHFE